MTKKLLRLLWRIVEDSQMAYIATSMAYTTVLSLVPLLAVTLSVAKALGFLDRIVVKMEPLLMKYLAAGTGEEVIIWLESSVQRINEGAMGSLGVITLLFISTKLLNDIDIAIQKVWRLEKYRPIAKRLFYYWGIIFFGPPSIAVVFALSTSNYFSFLMAVPGPLISGVVLTIVLFVMFKAIPAIKVDTLSAGIAALTTTLALVGVQSIYGYASRNLLYYNKVYGSLTSMFLFLVWVLIIWYVFLAGVALTSTLHQHFEEHRENT